MTTSHKAFLVTRSSLTTEHWDARSPYASDDIHYQPFEEGDGGPVRVPEAIFLNHEGAERDRTRRERAVRGLLNPFWFGAGSPRDLTSLPQEDFQARIFGLELLPPPPVPTSYGDGADWSVWWDTDSPNWTAEQRAAVWDLLDKIRLYEVVEIELE